MNDKPLSEWSDSERIDTVKKIFNEITPDYDRMNRIMSARQDVLWRKFLVKRIGKNASNLLDVATGTGDVALDLAKAFPAAQVIGSDFVRRMMDVALVKTAERKLSDRVFYAAGDAMLLPFEDNLFDAATIAFGMRNIPDRLGAVVEMARVVKPGGKVLVLEMTFPRNLRMRKFFFWYLNNVIPLLGRIIARNNAAYSYLPESIQGFLHPDELSALFTRAGLVDVQAFPLTFGITYLHEGVVA